MKHQRSLSALAAGIMLLAAASISTAAWALEVSEIQLKTSLVSATVYAGQAQVLRRGVIEVRPGRVRIVCGDLPTRFIESSLLVEGSGTARVRIIGIDLARREDSRSSSERYQELMKEYDRLTAEKEDLILQKGVIEERRDLMNSIKSFSTDKAHADLARQSFSIGGWKELLDFYGTERERVDRDLRDLSEKIDAVNVKLSWNMREQNAMNAGESLPRSVAVDCEVEAGGSLAIDLSYLVPDASWTPEYAVRFDEAAKRMEMTYNARISQATGEDWEKASVLLSTAEPHVGAAPPALLPLAVSPFEAGSSISGRVVDARNGKGLAFANVVVVGTKLSGMTDRDGAYRIANVPAGTYEVKAMMMGYQSSSRTGVLVVAGRAVNANFALVETGATVVEAVALKSGIVKTAPVESSAGARVLGDELHVRGGRGPGFEAQVEGALPPEAPAVSFVEAGIAATEFAANLQIESPVDLESGAEPKRTLVVRERFEGTVTRHAVPSLSEHVFLEGTFENALVVPLLPGLAEVYVESKPPGASNGVSTFVGREAIIGVAPGQTFSIHLGIDQGVKIRHTLDKKERLSKSGRKTNRIRYEYLVTMESFKREPVEIRVEDRIPVSSSADIKVADVEIVPEPDESLDNGLLTWKVPLAPGSKTTIRIGYTIAYPADWAEGHVMFRE